MHIKIQNINNIKNDAFATSTTSPSKSLIGEEICLKQVARVYKATHTWLYIFQTFVLSAVSSTRAVYEPASDEVEGMLLLVVGSHALFAAQRFNLANAIWWSQWRESGSLKQRFL